MGCKDGRWKELADSLCLMKVLILAVMNLEPCVSATRHLVNWSLKNRVINENIRRKSVCYEYRASSNVEFLTGCTVIKTSVCGVASQRCHLNE